MYNIDNLSKELLEHCKSVHFSTVKLHLAKSFEAGASYCIFNFLTLDEVGKLCEQGFSVKSQNRTWIVSKSPNNHTIQI